MIIFLITLTLISLSIAAFLGKELLRKFGYMQSFIKNSNQIIDWNYSGDRKPGMYNIVLRGQAPFAVLVGFKLKIPLIKYSGFDYYGYVQSTNNNIATISTYLGGAKREFKFLTNTTPNINKIIATSTEEDQKLPSDAEYKPHWYQRLGFYA